MKTAIRGSTLITVNSFYDTSLLNHFETISWRRERSA